MTEAESAEDVDPMQDADAWKALSREEQSDILDEGVADLRGEAGDGAWRHLSDGEQSSTIGAIERDGGPPRGGEPSETERAMQAALGETWTAEIFADLEDVPTVPFECRELDSREESLLQEAGQALMQIEDRVADLESEDVEDDIDLENIDLDTEHFSSSAEVEEWIPEFLADVTMDPSFDAERFRTGERLRPNTRRLLFIEVFLRYQEEAEKAIKFRAE